MKTTHFYRRSFTINWFHKFFFFQVRPNFSFFHIVPRALLAFNAVCLKNFWLVCLKPQVSVLKALFSVTLIFPSQWETLLACFQPFASSQVSPSKKTQIGLWICILAKIWKKSLKVVLCGPFLETLFYEYVPWHHAVKVLGHEPKFFSAPACKILWFVSWGRTFRTAVPFILDYCCYQYYPRDSKFYWFLIIRNTWVRNN